MKIKNKILQFLIDLIIMNMFMLPLFYIGFLLCSLVLCFIMNDISIFLEVLTFKFILRLNPILNRFLFIFFEFLMIILKSGLLYPIPPFSIFKDEEMDTYKYRYKK